MPMMDLVLRMKNQQNFLMDLAQKRIIKQQMALFLSAGFAALMEPDGYVHVPIAQQGRTLYAGPLPIFHMPDPDVPLNPERPAESLPELPRLEPYNQLAPAQ